VGEPTQLSSGVDPQLGEDLAEVPLDGSHRQSQDKAVWCAARPQSERRAERRTLRGGQLVDPGQVGTAQLVQTGVRELQLRLDTRRPANLASRCAVNQEEEDLSRTPTSDQPSKSRHRPTARHRPEAHLEMAEDRLVAVEAYVCGQHELAASSSHSSSSGGDRDRGHFAQPDKIIEVGCSPVGPGAIAATRVLSALRSQCAMK